MLERIAVALVSFMVGFVVCYFSTNALMVATITNQGQEADQKRVTKQLDDNQKTGDTYESARQTITNQFKSFSNEAKYDPRDDVDGCVLPADRLRRWRAANAGTYEGVAASQPDAGTPATTAAE